MLLVIIGVVVLLILLVSGWYAYRTQQSANLSAEKQATDTATSQAVVAQKVAEQPALL